MSRKPKKCIGCGTPIAVQPESRTCQNCGAAKADESAEPNKMLTELLHLQRLQKQTLSDIQYKVRYLFIYMIVGIVVGVISAWLFFANR